MPEVGVVHVDQGPWENKKLSTGGTKPLGHVLDSRHCTTDRKVQCRECTEYMSS